ncbi:MAG: hypothetical protein Q4A71_03825 [Actinomycetaceae bacterium]|nr:hypothetical protein [Actinomycetaceae bacterium]
MSDVLFVCTGNICRSAFAAVLLRHLRPDLVVDSAGTHALEGHGVDESVQRQLLIRGVTDLAHSAKSLNERIVRQAEIIFCMENSHMNALQSTFPCSLRKSFLLSYVEFLDEVLSEKNQITPAQTVDILWRQRQNGSTAGGISDPYRQSESVYSAVANALEKHVRVIARSLRVSRLSGSQGTPSLSAATSFPQLKFESHM